MSANLKITVIFLISLTFVGCGEDDSDSKKVEDGMIYSPSRFYALNPFEGQITKCENLGYPNKIHQNSGPILKLTILSDDGQNYILENFLSGKHAQEELKTIIATNRRCKFPGIIWTMRDSIAWD